MPLRMPISVAAFIAILGVAGFPPASADPGEARITSILATLATMPRACEHECFECAGNKHYVVESTNKTHTTIHLEACENSGGCGPHECGQESFASVRRSELVRQAIADLWSLPREVVVEAASISPQLGLSTDGNLVQVFACEGRVVAQIPLSDLRPGDD